MLTTQAHAYVDQLAKWLELVGVAIILGGIIVASLLFVRSGFRTGEWRTAYDQYHSITADFRLRDEKRKPGEKAW